jgi:hypothetical protein
MLPMRAHHLALAHLNDTLHRVLRETHSLCYSATLEAPRGAAPGLAWVSLSPVDAARAPECVTRALTELRADMISPEALERVRRTTVAHVSAEMKGAGVCVDTQFFFGFPYFFR